MPLETPRGLLWAPQAGGSENPALCPGGLVGAGPEQVKVCSLGGREVEESRASAHWAPPQAVRPGFGIGGREDQETSGPGLGGFLDLMALSGVGDRRGCLSVSPL